MLNYIVYSWVVTEECYPWPDPNSGCDSFCEGPMADCSFSLCKCPGIEQDPVFSVEGFELYNINDYSNNNFNTREDYLKSLLIDHGPLYIEVNKLYSSILKHDVCLVGFADNPSNGQTSWIMKNSWGLLPEPCPNGSICNDGYVTAPLYLYDPDQTYNSILPAVYSFDKPEYSSQFHTYLNHQYDKDHDGYWNWGLASIDDINFDPPCNEQQDWNDNNNRIGPADDNYFGIPIQPGMEVYLGHPDFDGRLIKNYAFCAFDDNDLSQSNTLEFYIKNTGTSQLNLSDPAVEEISDNNDCFEFETLSIDYQICHLNNDNLTQFTITFDPLCTELSTAKYKIDVHECDEDILEDFEVTLVYYNCADASGTRYIEHTESISDIEAETRDIIINPNATLTITGLLGMAPDGEIIIKPGGRLILDGGRITMLCDDNWNGIDVWGDASLSQYPVSNQGYLQIINGGCIEHADAGVQLTRLFSGVPSTNRSGGIIRSDNALFKNNKADVIFYSYNNFDPNTLVKMPNRSYFYNTQFINELILKKDSSVFLQNVDGIVFKGCTFKNTVDKPPSPSVFVKEKGILSFNSGFYIDDLCLDNNIPCSSSQPCRFENLEYGIYALNAEFNEIISIDTAVFHNTYRGIYMNLVDYPEIIRNQFTYDVHYHPITTQDTSYGINLEYCRNFIVEENVLTNTSSSSNMLGLQVLNSGPYAHEIYNNSFSGFYTGITAAGENRDDVGTGLCIKCNDFIDCTTDIFVTPELDAYGNPIIPPDPDIKLGIAAHQGEPNTGGSTDSTLAAGNTFSLENTEASINNDPDYCNAIIYTHHEISSTDKKVRPDPVTSNVTREQDLFAIYSKQGSCPSQLNTGGINESLHKGMLSQEFLSINYYEDTLSLLTDGGNTEGLNIDVNTSFPSEAMEIRQQLLCESPFLSDTVMKSAIEKENVLPNVMIRDILVANPQSAKSAEVLNTLDDRFTPMPDYMMGEIMAGINITGAKEVLENELAYHRAKRMRSLSSLERYYLCDTVSELISIDSLKALWQREPFIDSWYDLVFMYLKESDSIGVFNTLDSIPIAFELSDKEQAMLQQYEDLLELVWQIQYDTVGFDSSLVQSFSLLSEQLSFPGRIATNHLVINGVIPYNHKIFLPDLLKVEQVIPKDPDYSEQANMVRIFPNPCTDYFIIEYDLASSVTPANIIVFDAVGKQQDVFPLKNIKSQIVVNASKYSTGLYLVQLYVEGHLESSEKVIISE